MIVVTAHASIYTLVLMSLDRFLAVVHPITSMSIRTEKNALLYVKDNCYKCLNYEIKFTNYRAIIFAWIIIITTAIPVAISHGEMRYTHKGDVYTACIFLTDYGYNHVAFQVNLFKYSILKRN